MISHITSSIAFRARLAQVLDMRNAAQRLADPRQVVEEPRVEFAVDEAGARTLQLVRHPAGAEDHDAQVLVERLSTALRIALPSM